MTTRKYIFPACKQKTGVKIFYGLPAFEMCEAVEREKIILGGCFCSSESLVRAVGMNGK